MPRTGTITSFFATFTVSAVSPANQDTVFNLQLFQASVDVVTNLFGPFQPLAICSSPSETPTTASDTSFFGTNFVFFCTATPGVSAEKFGVLLAMAYMSGVDAEANPTYEAQFTGFISAGFTLE